MYTPAFTKQFKKDIKRTEKQGRDIEQFKLIARTLLAEEVLDPIFRDHKLTGNYKDRRECHISTDWLLIYKIDGEKIIFERIGSHSELFSK
ncbi:MAG: type II toxin-antitoxin system YafQ family toxin [Candidatus Aegiribacteria sp.]|nr:type II toxin-antitoxin system YafQ family toxin [Candidatus Aegiribacteria sp.]